MVLVYTKNTVIILLLIIILDINLHNDDAIYIAKVMQDPTTLDCPFTEIQLDDIISHLQKPEFLLELIQRKENID